MISTNNVQSIEIVNKDRLLLGDSRTIELVDVS